ncbi:MAG: outer membrane beta-barrel protein [Candidatus Marinimicrobia bacterium]|nr:outer membrane beta-barrel protein [Candidatus Neomarinimicrobiota bacterium]
MKKLSALLILLLLVSSVLAGMPGEQTGNVNWKDKTQLGLKVNGNYYLAFMDDEDADGLMSPGFGGFLDYRLTKNLSLNFGLEYNQINLDYPTYQLDNSIINATVKGKFFILRSKSFSPFVDLGLGVFSFTQEKGYFTDRQTSPIATGGLGAEIALSDKINLIPGIAITTTINEDIDALPNKDHFLDDQYITASLGISFKLGGKAKKPTPEPEEVKEEVEKPEEVVEEPEEKAEEIEKEEEKAEELEEKAKEEIEKKYYEKLQYMIKPNDYLIKIAGNIYEDKSMWNDIYDWNRDMIGDNPNLIYPFHELLLKNVPVDNANELEYEFYNYEVKKGETLWSVAAKEYGNPYAWIVIYRDNKNVLGDKCQNLKEGTILKLRNQIFNK